MVKKEDLHWTDKDTEAVKKYKADFDAGKIPYTVLTGSLRDLIQK